MTPIEFITQPVDLPYDTTFGGEGYIDCDYIVGVQLPGEAPIVHRKLPVGVYTTSIEVSFPTTTAKRVAEFYDQFFATKPPGRHMLRASNEW